MKVRCIVNNLNSDKLSPETLTRLKRYISLPDGELDLEIGKEYVVYGIEFWDNCPWLYLCPDDYDEYPIPVAADFFETIDKRLSTHWQLNSKEASNSENQTQLVFSEWASDESFYENLISGEKYAEVIFDKYRKIMDAE
ncbi:hypothetical protein CVG87_27105 [Pseudomonas sp. WCS365]|nr:hypothetical protein CVG87_27105 [Pseudomonas sp. WCS365]RDH99105.1 hypothetical protein DFO59_110136 [Pseudomonas fluorescens]ROM95605.1 hypothetical protein BK657_26430 [Pseudomonas brassicacearum]RON00276.1 hypothetical protein BK656_00585 [Pseudomonas brassicacearum]